MIKGAKLAYGHLALAAMLKAGHANLVWTTNFDHLLSDACAKTFGTTLNLNIVGLDSPTLAGQQIAAQSFPIEIKLHGDFALDASRTRPTNCAIRTRNLAPSLRIIAAGSG
jgi:hypothetical protein